MPLNPEININQYSAPLQTGIPLEFQRPFEIISFKKVIILTLSGPGMLRKQAEGHY